MEYRTLGKTGLRVSALSFGASSLASVFRPVAESDAIRASILLSTSASSANPENVKNAVRWIEQPIDPELLAGVRKILAPIQNKTWIVGRPENN